MIIYYTPLQLHYARQKADDTLPYSFKSLAATYMYIGSSNSISSIAGCDNTMYTDMVRKNEATITTKSNLSKIKTLVNVLKNNDVNVCLNYCSKMNKYMNPTIPSITIATEISANNCIINLS